LQTIFATKKVNGLTLYYMMSLSVQFTNSDNFPMNAITKYQPK